MIQLATKSLTTEVQQALENLQQRVNVEPTFATRAKKAQDLWDSKGGSAGKKAFKTITEDLTSLCVYVGVCNYCEQSEANDIEHINPKSFFPAQAFVWENYLLACKQCNSDLKIDKCFVLNALEEPVELIRGTEPPFQTVAFINPRVEDPNAFMLLTPPTYTFELLPDLPTGARHKALKTIEILNLNQRATLIAARKSAARHYFENLERIVQILKAPNKARLKKLLTPEEDRFDFDRPLKLLKSELKASYRAYITSYQHPSVWVAIKLIQSKNHPRWKELFDQLPEALDW
jgi:uncharacterized protein (TIGR02646 family)